jgi:multiple sugar transport system ATP-binding protein
MIEALGNETLVNVRVGAQTLVSRMPPRELPPPGQSLPLSIAPGRWHAFDAATGERLAPTG